MSLASPQQVMARLDDLESEMATAQNELEDAAMTYFKLKHEWNRRMAIALRKAEGANAGVRESNALIEVTTDDVFYMNFVAAEATYEALKLSQRSRADRASIGQSILRAQGRA